MEACAAFNKPLLIADRPNPVSGNVDLAEGPMLDEKNCASFIGRWSIPVRHSCTNGELANYFSAVKKIRIDISIIKNENWNRHKPAGDEWDFTSTSPAITDIETAMLYPGMGLMEGINVNEGRGTYLPFKIVGAPWIDSEILLKEFNRLSLPGVRAEAIIYTPVDSFYSNEACRGLRLTVTNTNNFKPVLTGIELIRVIQNLFPDKCEERLYKTAVNPAGKNHLDKLTGVLGSFEKIKSRELLQQNYTTGDWKEIIKPYLLY
jgi:uncharacterized protein YbbC (DUF1343 family)